MITRRKFFGALGAITGGFMILPPATTYQRIWKVTRDTTIEPVTLNKPVTLITPFRFLQNVPEPQRLVLPGEFSSHLMKTLFPLTHGR